MILCWRMSNKQGGKNMPFLRTKTKDFFYTKSYHKITPNATTITICGKTSNESEVL